LDSPHARPFTRNHAESVLMIGLIPAIPQCPAPRRNIGLLPPSAPIVPFASPTILEEGFPAATRANTLP